MENKQNIKLVVAYDGTQYLGWQKTKEGPSIEATLQNALEQVLQHPVVLQAASRTDAGVHATGQVVNFFTEKPIDSRRLQHSLNGLLAKDIVVVDVAIMTENFHPTIDCSGKEYRYTISHSGIQHPKDRHFSWACPYSFQLALMQQAANFIIGTRDFRAFCNSKEGEYSDYIREVTSIEFVEISQKKLEIRVTGKHFLYKMVRNIVGTLVYIGNEKLSLQQLPDLIVSGDRKQLGITAPAHGLCLHKVFY